MSHVCSCNILILGIFTSTLFQVSQAGDLLIEVYVERKEPDCSIIIRVSPENGCKEYCCKSQVLALIHILNFPLFLIAPFTCLIKIMTDDRIDFSSQYPLRIPYFSHLKREHPTCFGLRLEFSIYSRIQPELKFLFLLNIRQVIYFI